MSIDLLAGRPDYVERLAECNSDGLEAIELLSSMGPSSGDLDVLAVDWRKLGSVQEATVFAGHCGLETTLGGLPVYEKGAFNIHITKKGKLFFDYAKELDSGITIIERRIALPYEKIAVASLFRATTKRVPKN